MRLSYSVSPNWSKTVLLLRHTFLINPRPPNARTPYRGVSLRPHETTSGAFLFVLLLAPFLGASPTTSASILVEFGGNDWAAGCVVAHVFSHMYISLAVRHTPHTRIHCAAMLACEAPDPLARNTGVRSQGVQIAPRTHTRQGVSPKTPLDTIAQTGAGYECLVQEIAQQRFHGCTRIT